MTETLRAQPEHRDQLTCLSRRNFLILGGASVIVPATFDSGAGAQELVSSA